MKPETPHIETKPEAKSQSLKTHRVHRSQRPRNISRHPHK